MKHWGLQAFGNLSLSEETKTFSKDTSRCFTPWVTKSLIWGQAARALPPNSSIIALVLFCTPRSLKHFQWLGIHFPGSGLSDPLSMMWDWGGSMFNPPTSASANTGVI